MSIKYKAASINRLTISTQYNRSLESIFDKEEIGPSSFDKVEYSDQYLDKCLSDIQTLINDKNDVGASD